MILKFRAAPALLALTIVSLACQRLSQAQETPPPALALPTVEAASDASVSNVFMAKDVEGTYKTNLFAPKDSIHIFFTAEQAAVGTEFEARWYVLNAPNIDPNIPFTTSNYTYSGGRTEIHAFIQSSHEDGFSPSECKVEIYMEGVKVAEQFFTIE